MATHELKITPVWYEDVARWVKNFEVRNCEDREFKVGDTLILREWDRGKYTDRPPLVRTIEYVYKGDGTYGLPEGWCILGIDICWAHCRLKGGGRIMYKSPIEIICAKVHEDILDKTEEYIMLKIEQAMEVKVDKDEMIKALKYDRNQYEKGYDDAKQKYEKMLDKLADFLESLPIDVPCLALDIDCYKNCKYNAPTKECWIKWAEKEAEDGRK